MFRIYLRIQQCDSHTHTIIIEQSQLFTICLRTEFAFHKINKKSEVCCFKFVNAGLDASSKFAIDCQSEKTFEDVRQNKLINLKVIVIFAPCVNSGVTL